MDRTTRILITLLCSAFIGTTTFAQCRAPRFRKGRDYGASVYVSVQPSDLTINKLVCLAQTLRMRHPDRTSYTILVFSSPDGANNFQASHADYEDPFAWARWAKQLRAIYVFDPDKHQEHLDITPFGYERISSYDSRIDLPLVSRPHCRLEINDRCVMALDRINYPDDALKAKPSATVTLTGTVASTGEITRVQLASVATTAAEDIKEAFIRGSINNLRTLQLEPASHEDWVRIAYTYVIDSSLLPRGQVRMDLALPNQITIRANPFE